MPETEVVIVPYKDGPYLVRGPVVVRSQDGEVVHLSRHPIALCRCGRSRIRPFCDGTHQTVRFRAPSEPEVNPAVGASPQPERDGLRPGHPVVQAALGRAQQILTAALRDAEREDESTVNTARALVAGALALLQIQRPTTTRPEIAALFLIRGALQALEHDTAAGETPSAAAAIELRLAVEGLTGHR